MAGLAFLTSLANKSICGLVGMSCKGSKACHDYAASVPEDETTLRASSTVHVPCPRHRQLLRLHSVTAYCILLTTDHLYWGAWFGYSGPGTQALQTRKCVWVHDGHTLANVGVSQNHAAKSGKLVLVQSSHQ